MKSSVEQNTSQSMPREEPLCLTSPWVRPTIRLLQSRSPHPSAKVFRQQREPASPDVDRRPRSYAHQNVLRHNHLCSEKAISRCGRAAAASARLAQHEDFRRDRRRSAHRGGRAHVDTNGNGADAGRAVTAADPRRIRSFAAIPCSCARCFAIFGSSLGFRRNMLVIRTELLKRADRNLRLPPSPIRRPTARLSRRRRVDRNGVFVLLSRRTYFHFRSPQGKWSAQRPEGHGQHCAKAGRSIEPLRVQGVPTTQSKASINWVFVHTSGLGANTPSTPATRLKACSRCRKQGVVMRVPASTRFLYEGMDGRIDDGSRWKGNSFGRTARAAPSHGDRQGTTSTGDSFR